MAYVSPIPPRLLLQIGREEEKFERDEQVCMGLLYLWLLRRKQQQRRRPVWVPPWIQRCQLFGQYETLMAELDRETPGAFIGFMRMEPAMFKNFS